MNHKQISAALTGAGYSWRAAADAMGRTATALIRVSKRELKSRYVARALCALIDRTPEEVFPDIPEYSDPDPKETRREAVKRGREKLRAAGFHIQAAVA